MADKTLTCKDCGENFVFTESEQAFYAEKGFTNEPTRCPQCRAARKNARGNERSGGYQRSDRQMYTAVCASCGKKTEVPFKPSSDKPVYCRDCYQSRRR